MRSHPLEGSKTEVFTETFGTFTDDLERLRDWHREHKVREVAMESTGLLCAEQRVVQEGSSPSGARMRGAISKGGDNTSLAGEAG